MDLTKRDYGTVLAEVVHLIEEGRSAAARSVNSVMTATYWAIGRRIVEAEQQGRKRADYGAALIERLAADLTAQCGRGFGKRNLFLMRSFYAAWPKDIVQTASAQSFPLPWSHYVRLLSVQSPQARAFYQQEALRGGWTVRQLDRQIGSRFYERTALSTNKASLLGKAAPPAPEDQLKEPYVLEFLGLKDEYSESDLEQALIAGLESFLLELGDGFSFIGRQRRLRVGDEWFRVDLLFFHRKLRSLIIIDLKLGKFSHADAGQMHLYLTYAREHWMLAGENPPVGLILCAEKDHAVAHYALQGLPNKVLAAEYQLALPGEDALVREIERTREQLLRRAPALPGPPADASSS